MIVGFPALKLFPLDKTVFAFLCVPNRAPKLKLNVFLHVWSLLGKGK